MNFIKKNIRFICIICVILVVVMFVYPKMVEGFNNKPKVYGRDTCPWTIKQKKYLKSKNVDFDYVDCEKNPSKCPSDIESYPTTIIGTERHVGFHDNI